MIRLLIAALALLLIAAHVAAAAAVSCAGSGAEQCATLQGEIAEIAGGGDAGDAAPQPEDHASPCHDHCKSAPRGLWRTASVAEREPHAASPAVLVVFDPATVIPPPRL